VAVGVEVLTGEEPGRTGKEWAIPCGDGAGKNGLPAHLRYEYQGNWDWLTVFGVSLPKFRAAFDAHRAKGLPVACWDMGYVAKSKQMNLTHVRVSINGLHPTVEDIERTQPNVRRWGRFGIPLENRADPKGPIVVVGIGRKSRRLAGLDGWEQAKLAETAARFPGRRVAYRPKPSSVEEDDVEWPDRLESTSIRHALNGASLVICRHSNVAINACCMGIPVECEAGAAYWLYRSGPKPSQKDRMEFLQRLSMWQWRFHEMAQAWRFILNHMEKA
jgi:hypothetical protein